MPVVRTHHRSDVPEKKPLFDDTVSCFSRDPSEAALDEIVIDVEMEEQYEADRESDQNRIFQFDWDESTETSSSERSLDATELYSHYLHSTNGTRFLQFLQLSSSSCGSVSGNATSSPYSSDHSTSESLSRDDRDNDAAVNFVNDDRTRDVKFANKSVTSSTKESTTAVSLYCSSSMPSSPDLIRETIVRESQFDADELSVRLNELLATRSIEASESDAEAIDTCYAFSEYFDLYELFDIVV